MKKSRPQGGYVHLYYTTLPRFLQQYSRYNSPSSQSGAGASPSISCYVFQSALDGARLFGSEIDGILRLLQFFARLFEQEGKFEKLAFERRKQPPQLPAALFDGNRFETDLQTVQKGVKIVGPHTIMRLPCR